MIIGLTGRAGAGKSTVAEYLSREYGFERCSFAAPLYESAAALLGCTVDDLKRWKNDPKMGIAIVGGPTAMTIRQFLQRYGTEAHRDIFGEDFWSERPWINWTLDSRWVFDDVRFDNEAKAVREHGGVIVRIDRSDARLFGEAATHPSEAGVPADVVLTNDMEIVDLLEDVRHYMSDFAVYTNFLKGA
jgi:hypothetical protein